MKKVFTCSDTGILRKLQDQKKRFLAMDTQIPGLSLNLCVILDQVLLLLIIKLKLQ